LGSVSSLVSEKKIFEISANQSILLALAAILNIRLERKTVTLGVRRLLSVVCKLFTFQASSPKPPGRLEPNLAGMFPGWSSTKKGRKDRQPNGKKKRTKGQTDTKHYKFAKKIVFCKNFNVRLISIFCFTVHLLFHIYSYIVY
jgi:hypothetical protein